MHTIFCMQEPSFTTVTVTNITIISINVTVVITITAIYVDTGFQSGVPRTLQSEFPLDLGILPASQSS